MPKYGCNQSTLPDKKILYLQGLTSHSFRNNKGEKAGGNNTIITPPIRIYILKYILRDITAITMLYYCHIISIEFSIIIYKFEQNRIV